tara:strand:- start:1603 stop:2331 length:729 start_codon:yes stop_codon:yes gene_type:complete
MTSSSSEIKLDWDRTDRIGLAETIFCLQKSVEQIQSILEEARKNNAPLLLTRLSSEKHSALSEEVSSDLDYDPVSQTAFFKKSDFPVEQNTPEVAVVAAGTSDAGVAREALRTLEFNGFGAKAIFDVGVAGIWRLMERVEEIRKHPVVIAVAGMDAALPTVLGGLVPGAIIALPTSTGYGASRNGETALSACLSSCAPGVVVCNIDNGYGAACAAIRILLSSRQNEATSEIGQKGRGTAPQE